MHFYQKYFENATEIVELGNTEIAVKIAVNIGNTMYSIKKNEVEKLYFPYSLDAYKSNTKLAGNPLMHPWANRLEDNYITIEKNHFHFPKNQFHSLYRDENNLPLHGLLLKAEVWKTIALHEEADTCYHLATFMFDDKKLLDFFPFIHQLSIKHSLQNNELKIETTIQNLDEKPMPISFGFHPYFLTKNKTSKLRLPAVNTIEVNDKMIPTGRTFLKEKKWNFVEDTISLANHHFDDGFCNLKQNKNQQSVFSLDDIQILVDSNFPIVQVYAPKNADKPYVCIEPMTAKTNALNTNGCVTIKKNEKYTASFSIVL